MSKSIRRPRTTRKTVLRLRSCVQEAVAFRSQWPHPEDQVTAGATEAIEALKWCDGTLAWLEAQAEARAASDVDEGEGS